MEYKRAFQIDSKDNVATALSKLDRGEIFLFGDALENNIIGIEPIPEGHKIALYNIKKEEKLIKYGTVIGKATKDIAKGSWVHLHCICSLYDERSSDLDVVTGVSTDIEYK